MKRMKLKRKFRFNRHNKNKLLIIFIIIILGIIIAIRIINTKFTPVLMSYAQLESRKISSIVINNAINSNISKNITVDELFLIVQNESNEIQSIDFNPIVINKILTEITKSVQVDLKNIEQGKIESLNLSDDILSDYDIDKLKKGIIYEIPSGVVLGNSFLSNIGPKIPVKFDVVGDIVSYVNTKVSDYGINNALIEVNIVLELTEQVILPFAIDKIEIKSSVPIALKLVQGTVPKYYLNGMSENSNSLSIPIE